MKKIDGFMFYNEMDLLEIRLEYLYDYIDYFIISEAAYTQLGDPKPFYFDQNKERYSKYLDKIIHIKIEEEPLSKVRGSWANENYQRNSIARGFMDLSPNDIICLSDLDEIPKIEAFEAYDKNNITEIQSINQDIFYYYLNAKAPFKWQGPQIFRYGHYLNGIALQYLRDRRCGWSLLNNGQILGWHFAYQGGLELVFKKINSICESPAHDSHNKDKEKLRSEIENGNLYWAGNTKLTFVPLDDSFPNSIKQNLNKYAYMVKEV